MFPCPVCGSEDTRRSRKKTIFGFIKRWRGLQRYRCRDCGKSFYRPLLPLDRRADRAEASGHRNYADRSATRKKRQRRKLELLLFLGMLAIFYAALRILTRSS